jgi:acetylornithine deacetylase/succinyl-diaminopimelate desuccinylase-like protein
MYVDRRILPEETVDSALDEIRQIVISLQAKDPTLKVDLEVVHAVEPAATDAGSRLAEVLRRNIREVLGVEPRTAILPYYTEFRLFRHGWSAETIDYSPGRRMVVKGEVERVLVSDVMVAAKVLALTALDIVSG